MRVQLGQRALFGGVDVTLGVPSCRGRTSTARAQSPSATIAGSVTPARSRDWLSDFMGFLPTIERGEDNGRLGSGPHPIGWCRGSPRDPPPHAAASPLPCGGESAGPTTMVTHKHRTQTKERPDGSPNPTRNPGPAEAARVSALCAAIAAMLAGPAAAFEIDTGNPDVVLRWDNTLRYNLGVRTQSQDKAILAQPELRRRRPQLQQRLAGRQPPGPADRARPRRQQEVRLPRERRRLVRPRVQQPRQPQQRDGEHAGLRPARGRRALARTPSATRRVRRANCSTPSSSAASTLRRCRST